jgi:hypothetical protein
MFWNSLCLILVTLWICGVATGNTFGGPLHLLLLPSIFTILFRLVAGKRTT